MRIAQVAPLAEAVPPKYYGGTERVVFWLTEELVRQGFDVTLFASGDSETSAKLVPVVPKSLRLSGIRDHTASTLVMLDDVRKRSAEFDIIHFHIDLLQYPLFQGLYHKCLTTLHGRLDLTDFHPIYRAFPSMPLISISNAQRDSLSLSSPLNWRSTVHHGLPGNLYPFNKTGGDYLVFLGRIAPEKRPDRAIEIAKRAGVPLKIAAKIDPVDREYYEQVIAPLFEHPLVEYVGEMGDKAKAELLGNAMALLFPIDWPEPFGLVMIEAMSTGTPVIAWAEGSVPEVVEDGKTGFLVTSISDAVRAVKRVQQLDRRFVRNCFEQRFSVGRMACDYVNVYRKMLLTEPLDAANSLESIPNAPPLTSPLNGVAPEFT